MKLQARDLIAALSLVICAILLMMNIDGEVKALMGVIIGYYFHGVSDIIKAKRENVTQK